jgi:hypothetical protein
VDAVAGKVLLADDPHQPAVGDEGRRIVEAALEPQREAEGHDDPAGVRHDLGEHVQGHPLHAGREKRVLAAVARDAHLRQAEDRDPRGPRGGDRCQDAVAVAVPIERRLIERRPGDADDVHG